MLIPSFYVFAVDLLLAIVVIDTILNLAFCACFLIVFVY